jgi:hypothetical protein
MPAAPVEDTAIGSLDHPSVSLTDRASHRKKRKPLAARIVGKGGPIPPASVRSIIKAAEATAPPPSKGVAAHEWPAARGPPSPLPQFVKFADLREAGICATHPALRLLVEQHGFPVGRWFGANTRVWTVDEVMTWLAARPSERPVPLARGAGKSRQPPGDRFPSNDAKE